MVIQPVLQLYEEDGNRQIANRNRIIKVRHIMSNYEVDESYLNICFIRLSESLTNKDKTNTKEILQDELFFEVIHISLIVNLHKAYFAVKDKETLIYALKESYLIRGEAGAMFAWMPIVLRFIDTYTVNVKN